MMELKQELIQAVQTAISASLERGKPGRRAWLIVQYQNKDISEDISKYLLSATYTDNLTGAVDDISITLEDRVGLWSNEWFPEIGGYLDVSIGLYNWDSLDSGQDIFHLGAFELDEIEMNDPPATVTLKAVSITISQTSTLRSVLRNQTWENISLWKVANDIAWRNNLKLIWDTADGNNPNLDKTDQSDESDLSFLQKLCSDMGFALKIQTNAIVIFDEAFYEQKEPVMALLSPADTMALQDKPYTRNTTGYSFKKKTRDIYRACHVKYQKEKEKAVIEATFQNPNRTIGTTLEVNQQVDSLEEAQYLAKKKLREANKEETTGTYQTIGNKLLVAGITVELWGFGKFSGKYIITKATHSISSTYTTMVDLRRCLDGY